MEDASHLLVYRRFFGLILTVLPGLDLCYIVAALVMALIGDALGADFGWAVGFGAIGFVLVLFAWIFIGPIIERWAEDKPMGLLAGASVPFILLTLGGLLAFYIWVEALREERLMHEQEEARRIREGRAELVIEIPVLDANA